MNRWVLRFLVVVGVAAIAVAYACRPGGVLHKRQLEKTRRTIGLFLRHAGTPEMRADWSKVDDDGVLTGDEFRWFWTKHGQAMADQTGSR